MLNSKIENMQEGYDESMVLSLAQVGSKIKVDKIEETHPGYLHFLFWYTQKAKGYRVLFCQVDQHNESQIISTI